MTERTRPAVATDSPTAVYRYYDQHGILLYVGITGRAGARNIEHSGAAEWWPYVASQEVDHLPDRPSALTAERELIRRFRPPFNRQHNIDHKSLRQAYLAFSATGESEQEQSFTEQYRALGKRLPLRPHDRDREGVVTFISGPEHYWVAQYVTLAGSDRHVRLVGSRETAGRVLSADVQGTFLVVKAVVRRKMWPVAEAYAALKCTSMKSPPTVKLGHVGIMPASSPC